MSGGFFLELDQPDALLGRALRLNGEGELKEAIYWAVSAAENAGGPSFFESHALAAALLERVGQIDAALDYWEKMVISAPQKLEWLESALRFALRSDTPKALKYLRRWQGLLAGVYLAIPSLRLLEDLAQKGFECHGGIGVHGGQLRGWILLPRNNRPQLQILDLPPKYKFQVTLRPQMANQTNVLYEIKEDLPPVNFRIALNYAPGQPVAGSPLHCSILSQFGAAKDANSELTVIIPVYDDGQATLSCLGTVLASLKFNKVKPKILAVWDQGSDQYLLSKLRKLAIRGKIQLLENPYNMGFLASVNHALSQIKQGHVLLLNADTLVHGNWLDRMLAAANAPDAATVTALGNEAELMSYPDFRDRGKVSRLSNLAILDNAASQLDPQKALVEIPTGVGYCMLITREALKRVGGLDGRSIFRGYGEETHYCLRAVAAGLKNYGLFNTFVAHLGERSFGLGKKALAAQNNLFIHDQFPKHRREYETFLFHYHPRRLRRQVALNSLRAIPSLPMLEIRPWSGRFLPPWVKDEKCKPSRLGAALFLQPRPRPRALLRVWTHIPVMDIFFDLPEEQGDFAQALQDLSFKEARVCTNSKQVLDLAQQYDLPMTAAQNMASSAPFKPNLPRAENAVILVAPPLTLTSCKLFLSLARMQSLWQFYVFHWSNLWGEQSRLTNVRDVPRMEDYRPLGAQGFLMLDNYSDTAGWQEWLAAHNCADLPIYHGVSSD